MHPRNAPPVPARFVVAAPAERRSPANPHHQPDSTEAPVSHIQTDQVSSIANLEMTSLPKWKDMPPVKGMPHGCAWGLWDKPGEPKDQLGSLNLVTPEVIKEAFSELQTGERCALKSLSSPISAGDLVVSGC
jgi:hypothetical protein